MMTFLKVLVFILAQGFVVCDELYPISVLRDINQNQQNGYSDNNDDIEPLQEKSIVQPNDPDIIDINWIKKNIVDKYVFVKKTDRDEWQTQPNFEGLLDTNSFIDAADRAKEFFKRHDDWETTKKNPKFRANGICTNLLYITAARYLLVTRILFVQSGGKLIPCQVTEPDKKIVIPGSGVCYPPPPGSATCTSDYDVSLAGEDAGFLIENFNKYFQGVTGFGKPSDLVFDTNIYAFTVAYALPDMKFTGLPKGFAKGVKDKEKTVEFQMQELASAYFKVYKYNQGFFEAMTTAAEGAMEGITATKSKAWLKKWLNDFDSLNNVVKMRIEDFNYSPQLLREAHNAEYQRLTKEMSNQGGYRPELLGNLARAELYAAEAYHTRGSMRFVVGGIQYGIDTLFSTIDLWVTMIEHWGESNKEYNHCKEAPLVECFLKMSKYMWRMFKAMRLLRERIPASDRPGLVHFGEVGRFSNPEFAFQMWLDYKKQGNTAISQSQKADVKECLRQFECNQAVMDIGLNKPFPLACIQKMHLKVNAFNKILARYVNDVNGVDTGVLILPKGMKF